MAVVSRSSHQLEDLHSSLLSGIQRIVRKEMLSSTVTYSSPATFTTSDSSQMGRGSEAGPGPNGITAQITSLKTELEEKTDYCLKAVAQLNQSVFSAEKANAASVTDVKDLQQQVSSMDKQLKVGHTVCRCKRWQSVHVRVGVRLYYSVRIIYITVILVFRMLIYYTMFYAIPCQNRVSAKLRKQHKNSWTLFNPWHSTLASLQ